MIRKLRNSVCKSKKESSKKNTMLRIEGRQIWPESKKQLKGRKGKTGREEWECDSKQP